MLTTAEYLQTAESLRVQELIYGEARALIVQPDLMFISKDRSEIISDHIWGASGLVVEVMSPHPRLSKKISKLEERIRFLAQYGVKECWLIHQLAREIEVRKLREHGEGARRMFRGVQHIESSVIPDFGISPEVLECW